MRIVLFGPPGVGKGTQAKILSSKLKIAHISTGDLLREAVSTGTEIGKKAKAIMDAGHLISDDIMIGIIREVLQSPRCKNGFILDGFPRTVPQAEALNKLLDEIHLKLKAVINMEIDYQRVVLRLTSRLSCQQCGTIFNLLLDPVQHGSPCPKCGGELVLRTDDDAETVRRRLEVYATSTMPVKQYYKQQGLLRDVDADGSIESVNNIILSIVNS